ncbi:response regulator transcription factor [soil metagenome]
MRILVIEDEKKLAQAIKESLEFEHFEVCVAHTGEDGFFQASAESFDLIVLDLMLPGRDGIDVVSTLRKRQLKIPVIIITARDTVEDHVIGLDSGADDYLVKPFAFAELHARIRALLRRGKNDAAVKLKFADLELDLVTRDVARDGHAIELTTREYEILEYLLRHQESVVTREMIVRDIWKEPARVVPLDNVIDVHVARLRKKIDAGFDRPLLHTIRGVGFILRGAA